MEAKCSSENFDHTDRCYIPEDNIHGHRYKLLFRLRYTVLLSVVVVVVIIIIIIIIIIIMIGSTALGGP
jgi:predicted anti-sigma-YlaC factor YlaD